MALQRIGERLDYLDGAGASGVISQTISKRYSSEVEVVDGQGELADVIYSGEEMTVTETSIGSDFESMGAQGNTATIRSRVEISNEDVARTTNEKLTFEF